MTTYIVWLPFRVESNSSESAVDALVASITMQTAERISSEPVVIEDTNLKRFSQNVCPHPHCVAHRQADKSIESPPKPSEEQGYCDACDKLYPEDVLKFVGGAFTVCPTCLEINFPKRNTK